MYELYTQIYFDRILQVDIDKILLTYTYGNSNMMTSSVLPVYELPLKTSHDRLIIMMGVPIFGKTIQTGSWIHLWHAGHIPTLLIVKWHIVRNCGKMEQPGPDS